MAKMIKFVCNLPNGVHARPANHVEQVCKTFASSIQWHNIRTDARVDAKSVLSLVSSNTLCGDHCSLIISGDDEESAFIHLQSYLENEFPFCDEPLKQIADNDDEMPLPRSLTNLNPNLIRARSACGGIVQAKLQLINTINIYQLTDFALAPTTELEIGLIKDALNRLNKRIDEQISCGNKESQDILAAHQAIMADPSFYEQILLSIEQGHCCGVAIINTARFFSEQLANSGSDYLKERELDIRDICLQLLHQIYGEQQFPSLPPLSEPTICMADELTPSQFLALDKKYLKGLLFKNKSTTSHTIILARAFNIPTLVGVNIENLLAYQNKSILLDGNLGLVVYKLSSPIERYYQQELKLQTALLNKPDILSNIAQGDMTLISKACISITSEWQTKEEVIKGMTDLLQINGRCSDPRKLEFDLWSREDIFSTALGHGFAIPHTKSEHIEQSTISVAKLDETVKWGDEDVNFIIMLTLNKHSAGDTHMRIFSKLARKIMHQEFRSQLQNATEDVELESILKRELEL